MLVACSDPDITAAPCVPTIAMTLLDVAQLDSELVPESEGTAHKQQKCSKGDGCNNCTNTQSTTQRVPPCSGCDAHGLGQNVVKSPDFPISTPVCESAKDLMNGTHCCTLNGQVQPYKCWWGVGSKYRIQ